MMSLDMHDETYVRSEHDQLELLLSWMECVY